jgi:hypothetical protein
MCWGPAPVEDFCGAQGALERHDCATLARARQPLLIHARAADMMATSAVSNGLRFYTARFFLLPMSGRRMCSRGFPQTAAPSGQRGLAPGAHGRPLRTRLRGYSTRGVSPTWTVPSTLPSKGSWLSTGTPSPRVPPLDQSGTFGGVRAQGTREGYFGQRFLQRE